jgi:hypothetical protein
VLGPGQGSQRKPRGHRHPDIHGAASSLKTVLYSVTLRSPGPLCTPMRRIPKSVRSPFHGGGREIRGSWSQSQSGRILGIMLTVYECYGDLSTLDAISLLSSSGLSQSWSSSATTLNPLSAQQPRNNRPSPSVIAVAVVKPVPSVRPLRDFDGGFWGEWRFCNKMVGGPNWLQVWCVQNMPSLPSG